MRVLHLTEAAGGGVRKHLQYTVPEMVRQGVECAVAVFSGRQENGFADDIHAFEKAGCPIRLLPVPGACGVLRLLRARRWYRGVVRELAPAVVHAHSTWAGFLARSVSLPESSRPRVVYSPHGFAFQSPRPMRRLIGVCLERVLVRRTACFVFVSEAESAAAHRTLRIKPEKIRVAENGLPAALWTNPPERETLRERLNVRPDQLLAIVPGRLSSQKGQDWLIRALRGVDMEKLDLVVAFCGEGDLGPRLRRLAASCPCPSRFRWPGFVPDLPRHVGSGDLVVLPSRYEGLSYALLEALALGVPLIASDIPANCPRQAVRGVA